MSGLVTSFGRPLRAMLAALACAWGAAQGATAVPTGEITSLALGARVGDEALAAVRGGFSSPDGRVQLSFGLQQIVSLDGTVVARSQLVGASGGTLPSLVVQLGSGNQIGSGAAGAGGVVLQSSLEGRQLQVLRVLDVTVDSLQRVRANDLQRSVLGGVVSSLQR